MTIPCTNFIKIFFLASSSSMQPSKSPSTMTISGIQIVTSATSASVSEVSNQSSQTASHSMSLGNFSGQGNQSLLMSMYSTYIQPSQSLFMSMNKSSAKLSGSPSVSSIVASQSLPTSISQSGAQHIQSRSSPQSSVHPPGTASTPTPRSNFQPIQSPSTSSDFTFLANMSPSISKSPSIALSISSDDIQTSPSTTLSSIAMFSVHVQLNQSMTIRLSSNDSIVLNSKPSLISTLPSIAVSISSDSIRSNQSRFQPATPSATIAVSSTGSKSSQTLSTAVSNFYMQSNQISSTSVLLSTVGPLTESVTLSSISECDFCSGSRVMSLSRSSVNLSHSLAVSIAQSSAELSQSTPMFQTSDEPSSSSPVLPVASITTSISSISIQPSTSPYMFSSHGAMQPSPSLLSTISIDILEPSPSQSIRMQQLSDSPVNTSPFPSQSPEVMSTSIVIVSNEENAVYAAEIVIEQEFTDDLENQTSLAFMVLANRVVAHMTEVYTSIPGFIRVEVISFSNGSVVADTRVIFESNSTVTAENVTSSLQTANITGNNSLEILEVIVTRIVSMPMSSSRVYRSSSSLDSATSIVMTDSSMKIALSQSLLSPSSNINILPSKSSIAESSMTQLTPSTTSISTIPIQQTESSEIVSAFVSEVTIPSIQTASTPILFSSVSLLATSVTLTSLSVGDFNQSSLTPMRSSKVESGQILYMSTAESSIVLTEISSVSVPKESSIFRSQSPSMLISQTNVQLSHSLFLPQSGVSSPGTASMPIPSSSVQPTQSLSTQFLDPVVLNSVSTLILMPPSFTPSVSPSDILPSPSRSISSSTAVLSVQVQFSLTMTTRNSTANFGRSAESESNQSLSTTVSGVHMQSRHTMSNSVLFSTGDSISAGSVTLPSVPVRDFSSQSRLMSLSRSSVNPSQSLAGSISQSSDELSQSTPMFQTSNKPSPSSAMVPVAPITTSITSISVQPSTSLHMFSFHGTMQPSTSLPVTSSMTSLEPSPSQSIRMQQSSDSPINISPSPSQSSEVMSTSTVIVSNEENAVYAAEIVFEQEFKDDLENQTSPAFMVLANRVIAYMTEVYSSIPGFIKVEVISFSNGSVVADTRVIFESNSTVTTENVTNSLQTANITGNNSLEILEVIVTRIVSMPMSSSRVYRSLSSLDSATSIVMTDSSMKIALSQSLLSPSSNMNILPSKSSIAESSMILLTPSTTSISTIPIQQAESSGIVSTFVSEISIPSIQTASTPILFSSVSLLATSVTLTSLSVGDFNHASLTPMRSSKVEPGQTLQMSTAESSVELAEIPSVSVLKESSIFRGHSPSMLISQTNVQLSQSQSLPQSGVPSPGTASMLIPSSSVQPTQSLSTQFLDPVVLNNVSTLILMPPSFTPSVSPSDILPSPSRSISPSTAVLSVQVQFSQTMTTRNSTANFGRSAESESNQSLSTTVSGVHMQSRHTMSNSVLFSTGDSISAGSVTLPSVPVRDFSSQSRLMSLSRSSVNPSQSLAGSIAQPSDELSQSTPMFQTSDEPSPSSAMVPVAPIATSISSISVQPSTSLYMLSSHSTMQPSSSFLVTSSMTSLEPSPSQSMSTSTSAVIASNEGNAVYAAEIVIEQEFSGDLQNQSSPAFMVLKNRVVAYMTEVYSSIPGFIRVEVISFSNGSVVADTRVIFESNSTVTTENITNLLQTANITGNNSLEIIAVNVTRIESMSVSSSRVYMSSSSLESATGIVMKNSSIEIVPSHPLSSPNSNMSLSLSTSSSILSSPSRLVSSATSVFSLTPSALSISTIPIQQSISPSTYNPPSLNTSVNVLVPTSPLPTTLVPASGVRIFLVELTLDGVFNNNLENSNSLEFINLKLQVTEFLNGLYNGSLGFIIVNKTSFSPGSIVANSDVLFNETESTVTSLQLQTLIADAIRENKTGMLNILGFRVTEKGVGGLDDDGLETWIIVLIVCFSFAFLILVAVSLVVSKILLFTNCTDSARYCRHPCEKKI